MSDQKDFLFYKRSRFSTRLPFDRLYTAAHFWLRPVGETDIEVGMTRFAVRMLGDMVEADFEVKSGDSVSEGQIIGWIEGMKAAADLYSAMDGLFVCGNPDILADIERIRKDPYGAGWLYRLSGTPPASAVDAHGYEQILNETIDRIEGEYDGD